MTRIDIDVRDRVAFSAIKASWYTHITNPTDLALMLDPLVLRYSELLINEAEIFAIGFYQDNVRIDQLLGESVDLPGAIIPSTSNAHTTHSSVLYYNTITPDKALYRRKLAYCFHLENLAGYELDDILYDYLVDRLTSFYDNTDYELYSWNYKLLKFHSLSKTITHYNAFRYPRRFMKNHPESPYVPYS
jgi:hypothetical protein